MRNGLDDEETPVQIRSVAASTVQLHLAKHKQIPGPNSDFYYNLCNLSKPRLVSVSILLLLRDSLSTNTWV